MDGAIIKTEDGGNTWKLITPKSTSSLYQICVQGDRGWAVGEKGNFMVSNDGGSTWALDLKSLRTRSWFRDLAVSDQNTAWIVGASGTIIHTTDGGRNWEGISGTFIH
jgi:photosystem II stability/assembly factor-like uncharacterized protein